MGEELKPSRDLSGETVLGMRVAAYRETHPEHGDKYGHRYSEHWSTPSKDPRVKVERLFTEEQVRKALSTTQELSTGKVEELAAEWKRLEDAFHDALPTGQGEPGDGGVAGRAMCQFLYDNSETLRAALQPQAIPDEGVVERNLRSLLNEALDALDSIAGDRTPKRFPQTSYDYAKEEAETIRVKLAALASLPSPILMGNQEVRATASPQPAGHEPSHQAQEDAA